MTPDAFPHLLEIQTRWNDNDVYGHVNNVFNEAPQFVYAAPLANSDPNTYDFVGRFVYGRVQHAF